MICGVQVLENVFEVLRHINPPGCTLPLLRRMGNFNTSAPDTGMFFTDVSEGAARNDQLQKKARELQEMFLSTVNLIYFCAGDKEVDECIKEALRTTPSKGSGAKDSDDAAPSKDSGDAAPSKDSDGATPSSDAAPSKDSGVERGLANVSDHGDDSDESSSDSSSEDSCEDEVGSSSAVVNKDKKSSGGTATESGARKRKRRGQGPGFSKKCKRVERRKRLARKRV